MASAVGWRQTRGRVRFQPVLDDGLALFRTRNRSGVLWRPIWRRRFQVQSTDWMVNGEDGEIEPITFRSRARALRLAQAFEDLQDYKALHIVEMAEDLLDHKADE